MPTNLVRNLRVAWKAPRWRWALLIAGASDAVGFGLALFPPGQWLVDAATAAALFAVLGFRWTLLTALAIEAVPVIQIFPAWTLAVLALAALDSEKPAEGRPASETAPVRPSRTRRARTTFAGLNRNWHGGFERAGEAEAFDLPCEGPGTGRWVGLAEVVGSEVGVGGAVAQHVVDGGQDRGGDGADGLPRRRAGRGAAGTGR